MFFPLIPVKPVKMIASCFSKHALANPLYATYQSSTVHRKKVVRKVEHLAAKEPDFVLWSTWRPNCLNRYWTLKCVFWASAKWYDFTVIKHSNAGVNNINISYQIYKKRHFMGWKLLNTPSTVLNQPWLSQANAEIESTSWDLSTSWNLYFKKER